MASIGDLMVANWVYWRCDNVLYSTSNSKNISWYFNSGIDTL